MTRTFEGKNYYEILNVPLNAGLVEINRAYTEALEVYGEDALATYALFTAEQRKKILHTVQEAFRILSNRENRADYDKMLISTGRVEAAMFTDPPGDPAPERTEDPLSSGEGEITDPMAQYSKEEKFVELLDTISRKDLVSGEDIRQLREARGIDISDIFKRTRISKTTLQKIEQNQYGELPAKIFLKSFLRSYAEILQIDPENIVDGYLKAMGVAQ